MKGQVVSLGPTNEQAPDKATKYLSEKDSRVEKETRARETNAFYKNALSKLQKEGRNDKAEPGAPATSARPGDNGTAGAGTAQKRPREMAQLPARERRDPLRLEKAPDGTVRNRDGSDAIKGSGNRIAMADPGSDGKASSVGPGAPGAAPGTPGDLRPLKLTLDEPIGATGPITLPILASNGRFHRLERNDPTASTTVPSDATEAPSMRTVPLVRLRGELANRVRPCEIAAIPRLAMSPVPE